jgi:hypothetical protein
MKKIGICNNKGGVSMTLLAVIITAALVHGHGGKHSDKFTQLQALQKATILYDQLIDKGKAEMRM